LQRVGAQIYVPADKATPAHSVMYSSERVV